MKKKRWKILSIWKCFIAFKVTLSSPFFLKRYPKFLKRNRLHRHIFRFKIKVIHCFGLISYCTNFFLLSNKVISFQMIDSLFYNNRQRVWEGSITEDDFEIVVGGTEGGTHVCECIMLWRTQFLHFSWYSLISTHAYCNVLLFQHILD